MSAVRSNRAHLVVAVCALITVAILAIPRPVTAQQEQAQTVTELIKVTNVSLNSAEELTQGLCSAAARRDPPDCTDVRRLSRESMLAVTATPEVIARIRTMLAELDRQPLTLSFQIVVLSADKSGSGSAGIPANVRQALEDIRDFLPYTGFSLLGTGWIRTSGDGNTTIPGSLNLNAGLAFRPTTDPAAEIMIDRFYIQRLVGPTYTPSGDVATAADWQNVLSSTFTIAPGETVVVGTSKLDGDDTAVIVLLTAVQN